MEHEVSCELVLHRDVGFQSSHHDSDPVLLPATNSSLTLLPQLNSVRKSRQVDSAQLLREVPDEARLGQPPLWLQPEEGCPSTDKKHIDCPQPHNEY